MKLVVIHPFGELAVGAEITDPDAMKTAQADHPEKVVRVATDDATPAAAKVGAKSQEQ